MYVTKQNSTSCKQGWRILNTGFSDSGKMGVQFTIHKEHVRALLTMDTAIYVYSCDCTSFLRILHQGLFFQGMAEVFQLLNCFDYQSAEYLNLPITANICKPVNVTPTSNMDKRNYDTRRQEILIQEFNVIRMQHVDVNTCQIFKLWPNIKILQTKTISTTTRVITDNN